MIMDNVKCALCNNEGEVEVYIDAIKCIVCNRCLDKRWRRVGI